MQTKRRLFFSLSALFVFCAATAIPLSAQTFNTLYKYCSQSNCTDGAFPYGGLIQAGDGNFYGTTELGGVSYGNGTISKMTAQGNLSRFFSFETVAQPEASLLQASDGSFYGTTLSGGANHRGAVFKVTPGGTLTILYSFCGQMNCPDGADPSSGLVQARDGNLYGTTIGGGTNNPLCSDACGTVFKITPSGTLTTLYRFNWTDGTAPPAALVQATDGNLYGTTLQGGANLGGTVFRITTAGTLTTLYNFCSLANCADGNGSEAALVQATDGNLYGTTYSGGSSNVGTVFKITLSGTLTLLHSFSSSDGAHPAAGLIQATDGNFYGTTSLGGSTVCFSGGCGTIFKVTPSGTLTALHLFDGTDGFEPIAGLVQATNGNFYGTTYKGGLYDTGHCTFGCGTVFSVSGPPPSTTTVTDSPNPSMSGELVTITATVGPPGPPTPTGTVSFTSNGTAISGCTAVLLNSSRTAVCTTSALAVGTDAIVATYSGDSNYSGSSGGLSQLVNPIPSPLQFVAVTPCRLVDTRPENGGSGPIPGGTFQNFPIPLEGGCNIPSSAAAYSLNVSVVPQRSLGYLTIWPAGEGQPVVATLNSLDGRIKADAAIVPAGENGAVSVYVTDTSNLVLDINGYFAPASGSTLAFYPLTPCRIADTRSSSFPQGLGPPFLTGHTQRDFPILNATSCGIPSTAKAYSLNFSVVPHGGLGYLTVWPTGQTRPLVSTLNDVPGTIIANAAIVPAGTSGDVSVYPSNDTDLIIDINGYFAPPGTGGLSLYAVAPCRVIDTRHVGSGQPFSGTLNPPVNVTGSFCGPPSTAKAYVFNATVVPSGALGFLTLWPDGTTRPTVSTLNALDGSITNNMAIVPSNNGKVDAYASGITQLILDISSYFAP